MTCCVCASPTWNPGVRLKRLSKCPQVQQQHSHTSPSGYHCKWRHFRLLSRISHPSSKFSFFSVLRSSSMKLILTELSLFYGPSQNKTDGSEHDPTPSHLARKALVRRGLPSTCHSSCVDGKSPPTMSLTFMVLQCTGCWIGVSSRSCAWGLPRWR